MYDISKVLFFFFSFSLSAMSLASKPKELIVKGTHGILRVDERKRWMAKEDMESFTPRCVFISYQKTHSDGYIIIPLSLLDFDYLLVPAFHIFMSLGPSSHRDMGYLLASKLQTDCEDVITFIDNKGSENWKVSSLLDDEKGVRGKLVDLSLLSYSIVIDFPVLRNFSVPSTRKFSSGIMPIYLRVSTDEVCIEDIDNMVENRLQIVPKYWKRHAVDDLFGELQNVFEHGASPSSKLLQFFPFTKESKVIDRKAFSLLLLLSSELKLVNEWVKYEADLLEMRLMCCTVTEFINFSIHPMFSAVTIHLTDSKLARKVRDNLDSSLSCMKLRLQSRDDVELELKGRSTRRAPAQIWFSVPFDMATRHMNQMKQSVRLHKGDVYFTFLEVVPLCRQLYEKFLRGLADSLSPDFKKVKKDRYLRNIFGHAARRVQSAFESIYSEKVSIPIQKSFPETIDIEELPKKRSCTQCISGLRGRSHLKYDERSIFYNYCYNVGVNINSIKNHIKENAVGERNQRSDFEEFKNFTLNKSRIWSCKGIKAHNLCPLSENERCSYNGVVVSGPIHYARLCIEDVKEVKMDV